MNLSWDYKLNSALCDSQRTNPVVLHKLIKFPSGVLFPTEAHLKKAFNQKGEFRKDGGRLKAWGRDEKNLSGKYEVDPHWIAVRNGTPLHQDPPYPRYSHQLFIRFDDNIRVRGMDKVETALQRGSIYILDTHSPHQVFNISKDKGGWYVACSFDAHTMWDLDKASKLCLEFILNNSFYKGLK